MLHNDIEGELTYKERKFKQSSKISVHAGNASYKNTLSADEEEDEEEQLEDVPDDDGFGDVQIEEGQNPA